MVLPQQGSFYMTGALTQENLIQADAHNEQGGNDFDGLLRNLPVEQAAKGDSITQPYREKAENHHGGGQNEAIDAAEACTQRQADAIQAQRKAQKCRLTECDVFVAVFIPLEMRIIGGILRLAIMFVLAQSVHHHPYARQAQKDAAAQAGPFLDGRSGKTPQKTGYERGRTRDQSYDSIG